MVHILAEGTDLDWVKLTTLGIAMLTILAHNIWRFATMSNRIDSAVTDIAENHAAIKLWPDRLSKLEYQSDHHDKAILETRVDIKDFREDSRTRWHKLANDLQNLSNQYHDLSRSLSFVTDWIKEQRERNKGN